MQSKTFNILIIVLLLSSFSCKETPPEPGNGGGIDGDMLTVEDVGVTDAILHLRIPGGLRKRNITLLRDTIKILSKTITSLDSIIIDERLLPKRSYRYTLTVENFLNIPTQSYVDITTMDTTSHNFSFEIDTLGDGNSSILYDVAIVSDTCVYAVGEIYKRDSSGKFEYQPYNLARWNGIKWSLIKLEFPLYNYDCTVAGYLATQIISVYACDPRSILITNGGTVAKWNGDSLIHYPCITPGTGSGQILKIWGLSENSFYLAGRNGTLIYFDGVNWQKLESGTELDICDIWGSVNSKTGELEIMAVASKKYTNYERKILKISNTAVMTLSDSGINTSLTGLWFDSGKHYYVSGNGIFKKRDNINSQVWIKDKGSYYSVYYKNSIRANAFNDVIIACGRGDILHFNGYTWESYLDKTYLAYGNFYKVAIQGDMTVSVGENFGLGIAAIGRR